jgi:hypothetical protein
MAKSKPAPTPIPHKRQIEILRALGATDPASAAADGPHTLARWLFLTGLWRSVVDARSDGWQKRWVKGDPIGAAIARLAKGASAADVTLVVRQMQILALYNAVQLLDHPAHGIEDLQAKITENVEWRLASWDGEADALGSPLGELHGTFLGLDPEGRMGEPPPAAKRPRADAPGASATKGATTTKGMKARGTKARTTATKAKTTGAKTRGTKAKPTSKPAKRPARAR